MLLATAAILALPLDTPAAFGQDEHPTGRRCSPAATAEVIGFTAPFRQATLATLQQGRIQAFVAKEGQLVACDDLLVRLEADVQRARTDIAQLEAETTCRIELARVAMEHARQELERLLKLVGEGAAADGEMTDARAQADTTRWLFDVAKLERWKAVLQYQLNRQLLAQLEVRAPFSGYVTWHLKELGETVEEREGLLILAQLDPLLVSLDCPLELARSIHVDDRVEIRPLDPQWPSAFGTVSFIKRVADAASQTFKVKVIVPNQDAQLLAGLKVAARFLPHSDTSKEVKLLTDGTHP